MNETEETRDDAYYIRRAHEMIRRYGDCPQASSLPSEGVAFHLALRLAAANKRIAELTSEGSPS